MYVWAILAFLVYRGVAASRTRTASLRSLFIIPAVMTVLALLQIALDLFLRCLERGLCGVHQRLAVGLKCFRRHRAERVAQGLLGVGEDGVPLI